MRINTAGMIFSKPLHHPQIIDLLEKLFRKITEFFSDDGRAGLFFVTHFSGYL
jgi:hypothetical protein